MMSFFTLASNDQSYYYLCNIFGNIGTVLQPQGSATAVFSIMNVMFKTLNTTALIIGAILVTYTTVVGLLKTSQEGEFLGKQWNSMWVPLRMVMGIGSLVPTGAGYSVLQVAIMWVIVQGIGAADVLWTVVINYVNVFGSPYATVGIPTSAGTAQDVQTLYKDLVCADAAMRGADGATYQDTHVGPGSDTPPPQVKYYYCADHPADLYCKQDKLSTILTNPHNSSYSQICQSSVSPDPAAPPQFTCNIGPGGACGTITMSDYTAIQSSCPGTDLATTIQCAAYQAQVAEVPILVGYLETMASQTNQFDHDYMNFYASDSVDDPSTAATSLDWIQRRCTDLQLTGAPGHTGCCLYTLPAGPPFFPPQVWMKLMMNVRATDGKQHCTLKSSVTLFPPSNNSTAAGPDFTNMSEDLATKLIWTCGLQPIASNTTPPGCILGVTKAGNFLANKVIDYTNYINDQVMNAMTTYLTAHPPALGDWEATAQAQGWLMAGSYYYQMAQTNSSNLKLSIPTFSVTGSEPATTPNNQVATYRNNYSAANKIVTLIAGSGSSAPGQAPALKAMAAFSTDAGLGVSTSFMNNLAAGSNPLASMQQAGENLLFNAKVIYISSMAILLVLTIVGSINFVALGTGIADSPTRAGVSFMATWIMGLVFAYMAWAFSFGGILAVYMPLVPYTIFVFAAIGWLISVIEAMVAAPFIALGILSPGGQHEILGRAEPAVMLLLNIFLRPSLMIMGMMVAMLMASVLVSFINTGFLNAMATTSGGSPGLIETMLYISAYCSIVMTALNKCFGLIYMLPERVLTWIGGQAVSYGEAESVNQVKGAVESTANTISTTAKSTADAGLHAMTSATMRDKGKGEPKQAAGMATGSMDDGSIDNSLAEEGKAVQGPQPQHHKGTDIYKDATSGADATSSPTGDTSSGGGKSGKSGGGAGITITKDDEDESDLDDDDDGESK
jgi:hypothetical protein